MAEQLFSAEEAAQILGLQVRTVRNYVREGRLPGVRIGKQYRIARADLDAFTSGAAGREHVPATIGRPSPGAAATTAAEVSSVVQLDGVGPTARDRLERTLMAAAIAASGQAGQQLRVEPLYEEDRGRLRVVIVGPLDEVADLLRVLHAFTREPDLPAAV